MSDEDSPNPIPFSFFVSLLQAIACIKARPSHQPKKRAGPSSPSVAAQTLQHWINELHRRHSPLPPQTIAVFFRLLFPQEDVARKYSVQEPKLARYLAHIIAGSTSPQSRGRVLIKWKTAESVGCLGTEVEKVMSSASAVSDSSISMAKVDDLLTELAATCPYSSSAVRAAVSSPRDKKSILRELYSAMDPHGAAFLTQIILKDLRPLLYPVPETHYTASLLNFNSNAFTPLTKEDAMKAWDPSGHMLRTYRVRASLEEAANAFEVPDKTVVPKLRIPIEIPKCLKGQGCAHALRLLQRSRKIWAETKYDGERAQIHVQVDEELRSKITIFSKSKRNSTLDRFAVHSIIRDALGLPQHEEIEDISVPPSRPDCKVRENIILEAEMVAFSDTLDRIDEFWRIRSLISSTAMGARHVDPPKDTPTKSQSQNSSQGSLVSNGSDGGTRHLALVFFDILMLNSESLLGLSYAERRLQLESVLTVIPGYAMLAERVPISLSAGQGPRAVGELRRCFASLIADHQEGAVLKADEGRYNERNFPWVKLKRDYIPGYGDAVDLVILGAGWDKDRARELHVAPTVYTTFYVGSLANAEKTKQDPSIPPRFEIIFVVSFGRSREELEELNFWIKSSETRRYLPRMQYLPFQNGLPYNYNLAKGLSAPSVMLQTPLLAEIFGASFTKAPQSKYYEVRFPRIAKVFRTSERSWREGATLDEFQAIARESVGRDRPDKDVDDFCNALWGKPQSPGVRCPTKRKRREDEWVERLAAVDRKAKMVKFIGASAAAIGQQEANSQEMECVFDPVPDDAPIQSSKAPSPIALPTSTAPTSATKVATPMSRPWYDTESEDEEMSPNGPSSSDTLPTEEPTQAEKDESKGAIISEDKDKGVTDRGRLSSGSTKADGDVEMHAVLISPGKEEIPEDKIFSAPEIPFEDRPAFTGLLFGDAVMVDDASDDDVFGPLVQSPLLYGNTSIGKLLKTAVVWVARPRDSPRPSWVVPSHKVVPNGNQVHTLEAFLVGCGWTQGNQRGCSWAERGVIFVNDDDAQWMEYPMKKLAERRRALSEMENGGVKRKPIWIFSMKMLDVGQIRKRREVIERLAICKLD